MFGSRRNRISSGETTPVGIIHIAMLLLAVVFSACATAPIADDALILENVNIVDVDDGQVVRDQDIAIDDGRIAQIVPAGAVRWARKAKRIDLDGAYLTPALYDLHAHVFDRRDLQLYALMGVQMIRNMDGWSWHLELRDRPSWTEAWTVDLVTTGGQHQKPGVGSATELTAAINNEQEEGYDWVKLYDDVDKDMLGAMAELNPDTLRVTGHLPRGLPLDDVLQMGIFDDVAHAEELLLAMNSYYGEWRDGLDEVAMQMNATSTALSTTLVTNKMIVEQATDFSANISREGVAYAAPLMQMFWASDFNGNKGMDHGSAAERMAGDFDDMKALVGELSVRGVVILAGTDAPNPTTVPAFSLYEELELLVEAGLSPADAIRAATANAADHLGQPDIAGRIVAGALANITISRDNPLEDVSALQSIDGVFHKGEYKSRSDIDEELTALRKEYAADLEYIKLFEPSGPQAIFEALAASTDEAPISAAGLESLIWIYMKFGNQEAAGLIAKELRQRFPDR